jgi:hypothetical protein
MLLLLLFTVCLEVALIPEELGFGERLLLDGIAFGGYYVSCKWIAISEHPIKQDKIPVGCKAKSDVMRNLVFWRT